MEPMQDMRPTEPSPQSEEEISLPPKEERHAPKSKSGFTLKRKVQLALLFIVIIALIYGVWWIKSTMTLRAEAVELAEQAEAYQELQEAVETEKNRCEGFITQGEGDFGSFEYCKAFITWSQRHIQE